MAMFTLSDSFDRTWYDYLCSLAVSVFFAVAMLGEFTGQAAPPSSALPVWYIAAKVLACVVPSVFILRASYHSCRLARQAWLDGLDSLTSKELCFMVYATVIVVGMGVVFVLGFITVSFDTYKAHAAELLAHDISMVCYALIATALPVRIARMEGRRAQNMVLNTKRNVSHTLNAPLRVLLSELDSMLDDPAVISTMSREGVVRLARIALAADAAIGSLQVHIHVYMCVCWSLLGADIPQCTR
jgi:hypothetical protein